GHGSDDPVPAHDGPGVPRAHRRGEPAREQRRRAPARQSRRDVRGGERSHRGHQVERDLRDDGDRDRPLRGRRQTDRAGHPQDGMTGGGSVLTAVVIIIFVALVFDFINGFHDAANSIATVVSTRVLTPLQAVAWAAFFNFVAAFGFGVSVAKTVGKGVVDTAVGDQWVILAGLIGAIVWDLITWVWGLPTSSCDALIGGFAGAAVVKAGFGSLVTAGLVKIGAFMILAPLIGLVVGFATMVLVINVFKRETPGRVDKVFRRGQLLSAA